MQTSNSPVGKEAWLVIRPGFLFSYSPELGNSFLWGLVSAFLKLQERERKEKRGGREKDIWPSTECVHINSSLQTQLQMTWVVPGGNSLFIPFLLHTKYTFTITAPPSRVASERHLLCNLQLPKMMHNVPLERTIRKQYPAIHQTNPLFPWCWPQLCARMAWQWPKRQRQKVTTLGSQGQLPEEVTLELRLEGGIASGRKVEECCFRGNYMCQSSGWEAHEHQKGQKGAWWLKNAKMVWDEAGKANGPDHYTQVKGGARRGFKQ